ncbi:MAG TPA: hypothetical protein VL689_16345 [Paraburkholderia sp.]|jgi:hypothetical protein|nr:hypothetical protein [Paraburkholderia sp.]
MTTLTAMKEWLKHEADGIVQSARDSLRAWMLLGQTRKYGEAMAKVAALRRIAEIKSVSERRFLLRELSDTPPERHRKTGESMNERCAGCRPEACVPVCGGARPIRSAG